jgi:uncharacterized membrane-anchored protein
LALPVVAIVVGIVRAEVRRSQSQDWTFAARGYDPRDLLRGRYVRFRIDFAESAGGRPCSDSDPDCALCLTKAPGSPIPHTRRTSLAQGGDDCDGILQTRFIKQLDRYYIPEHRADELDRRVREAAIHGRLRVVLSIDSSGRAEVRALAIGDERLE